MKTHTVLDLHYLPEEGQGCFDGTQKECEEFSAKQTPSFMYKVVPMTKEEMESHPDNQIIKTKTHRNMKKLSLVISLYFLGLAAYSQNYLNYSKREIINALTQKGDGYEAKYTTDGTPYVISQDRILNSIKLYYFDDANMCYLYVISYFDLDYSTLVELLDKNYSRSGSYWYSSNAKINVKYNSEYSCYEVIFVRK